MTTSNRGVGLDGYHARWYSSRDWRFYKSQLALIVQYSEPGPILDVGAGCGFIVEGAKLWGMESQGLEGSDEAIEMANRRRADLTIKKHLISDSFPFPDRHFQTVVMNQVIEHLESSIADRCLAEVFRVLKPGGMFLITSPSKYDAHEHHSDPTHINLYSAAELKTALAAKGFENIISLNTPLALMGQSRVARGVMSLLYKITSWDRLSATASFIAYRALA